MTEKRRLRPPLAAGVYNENISAGGEVELFSAARQGYSGISILCRSSHDIVLYVDSGVVFDGVNVWMATRSYVVPAGAAEGGGINLPVDFSSDFVRVRAVNPGEAATTQFHAAGYLIEIASAGLTMQKPAMTLWDGLVIPAASGNHYSPVIDLSNILGARVYIRRLNGPTGPTVQASAAIQVSPDGVMWHDEKIFNGSLTTANYDYVTSHSCDITWRYARVRCGGNTGQPITVWATATLIKG